MCALYAFLRVTDDLTDEPGAAAAKRAALDDWRHRLNALLAGEYSHPPHPAFHHTVRRHDLPRHPGDHRPAHARAPGRGA